MSTTVTQEQGFTGLALKIPRVVTQSTLAQVTTAGWWNNNPINGQVALNPQDLVAICYAYGTSSQATAIFSVSIGANGIVTLMLSESNVVLPVVSGHFANFSGTSGAIADDGYLPSNAAKTRVVMANGTVIANHIGVFTDTTGTLGQDATTAINGGGIQAGLSGTAGKFTSFPATASNGSFIFEAINNTGGFNSTFRNSNIGQATVYSLPDTSTATANVLAAGAALVSGNLVQASGTGGAVVDSGVTASGLQILSASVTLNQAAVQAMYTTPFQIIAAQANKVIVPVQVTIYTNFQTAAFSGGGVGILQYDNTTHGGGTNALTATIPSAEITASSSQIYSLGGVVASALTGITNKGLFLSNQTGAFAGGNAASTVVVTVSYYLVTATV